MGFLRWIVVTFFVGLIAATPNSFALAESFSNSILDDDWNVALNVRYGLPMYAGINSNLKLLRENNDMFLRISLSEFQIGKTAPDSNYVLTAPFWERAELVMSTELLKGSSYEINFKMRIVEGFETGFESLFTLVESKRGCLTRSPLALRIANGRFFALATDALGIGSTLSYLRPIRENRLEVVRNVWVPVKVLLQITEKQVAANINLAESLRFVDYDIGLAECGGLEFRLGISRPGSYWRNNSTSIIDYDDLTIHRILPPEELKKPPSIEFPVYLRAILVER